MQRSLQIARFAVSLEISAILRGETKFEEIINGIAEQFWRLSTFFFLKTCEVDAAAALNHLNWCFLLQNIKNIQH